MGIWQNITKFFNPLRETDKAFYPVARTLYGGFQPYIGADDKSRYIDDFERVKYAYSVISWIAKKAAKVPFVLFNQKADGSKDAVKVNAFLKMIERPNAYQSSFEFKYQAYGYLLSTGALYIHIPKLSSGRWTEMHIIPSDYVQPVYERRFEGPKSFIINDTGLTISADEMLYVFQPSLAFDQVGVGESGHSAMKSLLTVLKKTADIDKADLATIQNGGVAGIITDRSAEMGITLEQQSIIETQLKQKAYGPENKGKFLVTAGDVSFIPLGLSPIDLNLYQANMQVLRDICIVYHVPYIIFDQTDSNASFGTAMREARKMAYTDAILPLVEMIVDAFNAYGLIGFGKDLVLDYDTNNIEELQIDAKMLAETLNLQYWKSVADKQRESGLEVDPRFEGVYFLPSGLVKYEETDFNAQVDRIEQQMAQLEKDLFGDI
jgi:HK97 family phage portal protein